MYCRARYLFIAVVLVLGSGQMITACGQKGDLYLPEQEQKPKQVIPKQPETDTKDQSAPATQQEPAGAGAAGDKAKP